MTTSRLYASKKLMGALLLMMGFVLPANAQFLRTSYFMEGTHYRQQLNPALIPTQGYFNIPVLGSVNATVGSTSLGYQDIIDIIDDSDNFYSNPDFLSRLKDKNNLNVNVSTEILSAGWYKGKNFWSFNVGVRADIGASLTRSMFTFLNEMDALEDNWRNSNYDISGQKLDINAYGEVGLGYARQINNRLTVGGKVKVLLGIGNMNLKINNVMMNANLPSDARINQLQDQNYLSGLDAAGITRLKSEIESYHANLNVDAHLESSFKGLELVQEDGQDYISDFDFDSGKLGIAGYGFGIDLGASYKIMDNLTVSASVLDLGFISWTKGATKIASANPESINMKGTSYVNGIDPNDIPNSITAIQNNITRLQADADGYMNRVNGGDVLDYEMLQLQTEEAHKSRKSSLASTVVVGAEYGFFENKLGVGVLSTTRFVQPKTLTEVTFSANYRPKSWLNVALSYSAIQSAGKSFGLGLKLGPVFLGTDYMFLGKNTNSVSGFVGISVPLGGKKSSKEG
ncbi:DUF5723 family protein [Bacteroides thetaiotaomicron]|uniref:DUF5723 family protein n=1 Tax=Bacteroides thetaiotaomicron TaxID=818 RepID=UPI002166124A|nr:DUF5723 family protein [Bacteroides thetaiotaomicron]MCS3195117.1 DUF5723 family protein [Bacteroides thetaiotaomicron]